MHTSNRNSMPNLEKFYCAYFPIVYNYIFYKTLSAERTEALAGRVFAEILQNPGLMKDRTSAEEHLFAVAERLIREMHSEPCAAPAPDAISDPVRSAVLSILRQLSEEERMLVYCHNCLSGSSSAVGFAGIDRSRLSAALEALRPEARSALHGRRLI